MSFSDVPRYPSGRAVHSTAAVTTLAYLREATFPQFIDPPQFVPRGWPLAREPTWLERLLEKLQRQMLLAAATAAAVLLLATTLPALVSLRQGDAPAAVPNVVRSSAGPTGTAATRLEDLSATTFLGQIPFVQQLRYLSALAGSAPEGQRFIEGAREASLAQYLQSVSIRVALPYLGDTLTTKEAIEAWTAALEQQRAFVGAGVPRRAFWQALPITPGTRIPGATVTFYACIGNGFCGNMASGLQAFDGAAACSADLPFGTRFTIVSDSTGRVFECLDRGALASPWVDIWFYDVADGWAWQSLVGTHSDIIIVE